MGCKASGFKARFREAHQMSMTILFRVLSSWKSSLGSASKCFNKMKQVFSGSLI